MEKPQGHSFLLSLLPPSLHSLPLTPSLPPSLPPSLLPPPLIPSLLSLPPPSLSFPPSRFLHRESYQFFSRGKIWVKGLGERQTYFVEPGDEVDTMISENSQDSDSETNSNVGLTVPPDAFLRSPSFVKYNRIKPVQLTPFTSNNSLTPAPANPLQMLKPCGPPSPRRSFTQVGGTENGRISIASNASAIFIVERPSEENGLKREFNESQKELRTKHVHRKRHNKNKCKVS